MTEREIKLQAMLTRLLECAELNMDDLEPETCDLIEEARELAAGGEGEPPA